MTVIIKFLKNDFIRNCAYSAGEIAGFDDWIASRLIEKKYAVLHGDGKPKQAGGKIPGAKDWLDEPGLADHVAELKKTGKWPAHLDKPVEIGAPKIVQLGQYGADAA